MNDSYESLLRPLRDALYPDQTTTGPGLRFGGAQPPRKLAEQDELILRALVQEAIANGLLLDDVSKNELGLDWPTSGSTARAVVFARQPVRFAVKIHDEIKIVEEARLLRACQTRRDLPQRFRDALPKVYAIKEDRAPYAYILQHFTSYKGLDSFLYKDAVDRSTAQRLVSASIDILFETYDATAKRSGFPLIPCLRQLYLERIKERIKAAADHSAEFAAMLDRPLRVNGTLYSPYNKLLAWLKSEGSSLQQRLAPSFATFVHGDIHPENILLQFDTRHVDVKFIDPKEWGDGDYVFDLGKIVHYLDVTGPLEKGNGISDVTLVTSGDETHIEYELSKPEWTDLLIEDVRNRAGMFARSPEHPDPSWELRYQLSMASNLLGLVANRLNKGRKEVAYVMFAEGLKWLSDFQGEFRK